MAELALAIVPLCIATIKGGKVVLKRLEGLRQHNKEIKRPRKLFGCQREGTVTLRQIIQIEVFLDECEFILQQFLDIDLAYSLTHEVDHPGWYTHQVDEKIRSHLGDRFGRFENVVRNIHEHINDMDESLNAFSGDAQHPDVKLKGVESTKEALDLTRNRSKYESLIEDFRIYNHALNSIGRNSDRRGDPRAVAFPQNRSSSPLPSSYRDVSKNSKSFHTALSTCWSCTQVKHTGHEARLFLDHRTDASFRVVVRYRTQCRDLEDGTSVDVLVRSESLNFDCTSPPGTSQADDIRQHTIRVRRVRFEDESSSRQTRPSQSSSSIPSTTATPMNLGSSADMCTQLCTQTMSAGCSCYLDSSAQVRHLIHPVCHEECDHKECLDQQALRDTAQLDRIFDYTIEESGVSVNQQVRLALTLVNGILQFASTPWLQPSWYLRDLSYFQTTDGLATALATLHISSEIPQQNHHGSDLLDVDNKVLEAQLVHGVSNLTLYSLGRALLQIGYWSPLWTEDISMIRLIAECSYRLGPVYQRITQQCLEGNFASSKDLSDPDLQNAIYRDVVCKLKEIVTVLEGGTGAPHKQ
ncbi:hypothetical protein PG994_001369 [Apiospora phragmitis]|uniref:DUF7580 domain-containing protein n=1 Tax=Apiospora phragmitis TaxID=2905665 RepID=A0ABR1WTA9_9PEZI